MSNERPKKRTDKGSPQANFNNPRSLFYILRFSSLVLLLLLHPGFAAAQKLDADDLKFLADVRPLMLSDEESTYKNLKDKADRAECQKIFWARRDPDLTTPQNEYQEQYRLDRTLADKLYRTRKMSGATTDCGRLFILLGRPDEVWGNNTPDSEVRTPEFWTYYSKPGRTFQGDKAKFAFDEECRGTKNLALLFDSFAASRIAHPEIDYRIGQDGHIVKLADLLPRDTQARRLFKQPRQDFPIAAQATFLKAADGGTALLGLVRLDPTGLVVAASNGTNTIKVSLAACALAENGTEAGWTEQPMSAPLGPDGAFVGAFKLWLKPGKYTLKFGALDLKSGKGALAAMPVEAPDFAKTEPAANGSTNPVLSAAPLLLVRDIENFAPVDPTNPFEAFRIGTTRLLPYFGTTFRKTDKLTIFYQVYDLGVNSNGVSEGVASLNILHGSTSVVSNRNPITTAMGSSIFGPVVLTNFDPGKYVVRFKFEDNIAKKDVVQDTSIEVVP